MLEGRLLYETSETQRRIALERMIYSMVKSARKMELPKLGNVGEGNVSLWLLELVFTFVRDSEINSSEFPQKASLWELDMPYWNAVNLMEREVLDKRNKQPEMT